MGLETAANKSLTVKRAHNLAHFGTTAPQSGLNTCNRNNDTIDIFLRSHYAYFNEIRQLNAFMYERLVRRGIHKPKNLKSDSIPVIKSGLHVTMAASVLEHRA